MCSTKTLAAALIVAASMACASESQPSVAENVAAIHQIREDLRRFTREGDVAGAMSLFTDDAVYMRPRDQADVGKTALTAHWEEPLADLIVDIDYRAEEVEVAGDFAFLRGDLTYTGTWRAGDRAPIVSEQRYVWVLRREPDGQWRIARYIRHAAPR